MRRPLMTLLTAAALAAALGAGTASAQEDLDPREANVVAAEAEPSDGAYTFRVTLFHDDGGEPRYADWWQVETLDGTLLGRRDLLHPHGTREFTRSETIEIPPTTRYVAIRGHDRTHGYGGLLLILDLETGGAEPVDQGPEPIDLSDRAPTATPNPTATATGTATGTLDETPTPTPTRDAPGPAAPIALAALGTAAHRGRKRLSRRGAT